MDSQNTTKSLIDAISSVIGGSYLISEDRVIFFEDRPSYRNTSRVEPVASLSELEELISAINNTYFIRNLIFYNGHSFEMPVLIANHGPDPFGDVYHRSQDKCEGLEYRIGLPSKEFIVHVLLYYTDLSRIRFLLSPETTWDTVARTCDREKETIDVFDLLGGQGRFLTIRIDRVSLEESRCEPLGQADFESLAASLIYQITYNTNEPIIETRSFDTLLNRSTQRGK